jgi:2-amino-4-hydroxy-6-hydroxymethyldihydropteridine diphosphokinase
LNTAYLILGSNINPEVNIPRALGFLDKSFSIHKISDTWKTRAVGAQAEDFLNTAVEIETGLDMHMLKEKCLCHIEEIMGRIRQIDKNAPRTIDIDIVIFNNKILDYEIFTREHLALPLSQLIPDLVEPQTGKSLKLISETLHRSGYATNIGYITSKRD